MKTAVHAFVLMALLIAGRALGAPEPSPFPANWELKLEPTPPMRIQADSGKGPVTYWYMLYTVTNHSSQDVDFNPEIARVSEVENESSAEQAAARPNQAPQVLVEQAIVGLPTQVFEAIRQRHSRTHPFLVTPVKAIGRLLQGKDNARTSVAVFSDLDPRVSKFTLYFGGLSGERIVKPNPAYDARRAAKEDKSKGKSADEDNPKIFVLRKTLAVPYTLPGDERTRRNATPVLGRMSWVMR